jgi:hypothetical protein
MLQNQCRKRNKYVNSFKVFWGWRKKREAWNEPKLSTVYPAEEEINIKIKRRKI